jgi:hypothetical protein
VNELRLVPAPTLDDLARDPSQAAGLPQATATSLYARAAGVEAALRARLLAEPSMAAAPAPPEPEEWLSAEQVGVRFGLSPAWLAAHRGLLRQRGIVSQPSRKTRVFHARRLARFLELSARDPRDHA